MRRFDGRNGKYRRREGVLHGIGSSVLIFLVVLILFLFAIGKTTEQTMQEQKRCLEEAVERSMLQCYVTEGRYPESFSYLETKYGIVYDKEHFRVDYIAYGSNMRPEITIVELEGAD